MFPVTFIATATSEILFLFLTYKFSLFESPQGVAYIGIIQRKVISLLHMKITVDVTKSSRKDRGPCYFLSPRISVYL